MNEIEVVNTYIAKIEKLYNKAILDALVMESKLEVLTKENERLRDLGRDKEDATENCVNCVDTDSCEFPSCSCT